MPEIDYTSGDNPSEVLDEFWRETLSGIRNGRWGSDIRTPIHAGILQLIEDKEIPEEEIEAALQKIVESIYGEEVRMAIHDALFLIHQESTKVEVEERIYYVDQLCKILEVYLVDGVKFGIPVAWPESGSSYFADNATGEVTEITINGTAIANGAGLLFVLYEQGDAPTISDSESGRAWFSVKKFTPSGSNLVAEAFYASIGSGLFTVTLTKTNASSRFHATLRVFYEFTTFSITDEENSLSGAPYTPNAETPLPPSGSKRYYILANTEPSGGMSTMITATDAQYEYNANRGEILECYLYSTGSAAPIFDFSGPRPTNCVFLGLKKGL